jgi:2,5-diketo-D-gluconate reductase A
MDILTQGWSPPGGISFYQGIGLRGRREEHFRRDVLHAIGDTHGKSAARVMLRWHLQRGRSAIPKSVKPQRTAENFDISDFELSADEFGQIDDLDTGTSSWQASAEMDEQYLGPELGVRGSRCVQYRPLCPRGYRFVSIA